MKPRDLLESIESAGEEDLLSAEMRDAAKEKNGRVILWRTLAAVGVAALLVLAFCAGLLVQHRIDKTDPTVEETIGMIAAKAKMNGTEVSFDTDAKEAALKLALKECGLAAEEVEDVTITYIFGDNLCCLRLFVKDGRIFDVCIDTENKSVVAAVEEQPYGAPSTREQLPYFILDDANVDYYVRSYPSYEKDQRPSTGYIVTDPSYGGLRTSYTAFNRAFFTASLDTVGENGDLQRTFYIIDAKDAGSERILFKETFKPYDSDLIYNESSALAVCTFAAKARGGEKIEYKGHKQYTETVTNSKETMVLTFTEMYLEIDGVPYCYLLDHYGCLQEEPTLLENGVERSNGYLQSAAASAHIQLEEVEIW